MQKLLFIIKVTFILSFILWGCVSKSITGEIKEVKADTICIPKYCFKLLSNAPRSEVGKRVTFTPTKNKSIVNCKILKP